MQNTFKRLNISIASALFIFIASIYMLTYSGFVESGDTLFLFNAVGSLVRHGDWLHDLTADERPRYDFPTPPPEYPLGTILDDPLSVVLATPLFWLAYQLPGVGLVHIVWLFNVLVGAGACAVMYAYALALGYDRRTGVLAGIALGLGTMLWVYSKTFFQEPLTLLITLLIGLLIQHWRLRRDRSLWLMLSIVILLIALPLSKQTALAALPGLVLIALPSQLPFRLPTRLSRTLLLTEFIIFIMILVGVGIFAYFDWQTVPTLASLLPSILINPYMRPALQSYLFSIGGSFWGTSPVLLLAIIGIGLLFYKRQTRYIWVALLVLLGYAAGYAILRGQYWFGGLSWPPRFLLPIIPYVLICALPAIERATRRPLDALLFALLMTYSIWVQFNGVAYRWAVYPDLLPPDTGIAWSGGVNNLRYLRWVILPQQWARVPFDFVWVRTGQTLWAVMFAALATFSSAVLGWVASERRLPERFQFRQSFKRLQFVLMPATFLVAVWIGLRMIYLDPEYFGQNQQLHQILAIMDEQTEPRDLIFVVGREPLIFMRNYYKLRGARLVGVTYQPGETYSPEVPPIVRSSNVEVLLAYTMPNMIYASTATRDSVWLLMDSGPDLYWSVRPIERLFSTHFYTVQEIQLAPTVRLLEYSTIDAPDALAFRSAEHLTNLIYGDELQLTGFNLPVGQTYAPGDLLPISLYWQAITPPNVNYTVATFLTSTAGDAPPAAQGRDSYPAAGFELTSGWDTGIPHWDNRVLRLPETITMGEYQLWVVLYSLDSSGTPQRLTVTGSQTLEGTIGILPIGITIVEP